MFVFRTVAASKWFVSGLFFSRSESMLSYAFLGTSSVADAGGNPYPSIDKVVHVSDKNGTGALG